MPREPESIIIPNPCGFDSEIEAMSRVYETLRQFPPCAKVRMVQYILDRFLSEERLDAQRSIATPRGGRREEMVA
jgi:hypothetical protein